MRTTVWAVRWLSVCSILALSASWLALAAPRPGWWPEGKRPPFAELAPEAAQHPRAVLLKSASLLTSGPEAADTLAFRLPAALRGAPVERGGWLLVQFTPESTPAQRDEVLARHAAAAGDYIPNHTRLARVPAGSVAALANEPSVVWLGRLHPAFKLAPDLGAQDVARATWQLTLLLAPDADFAAAAAEVRAAGATVTGGGERLLEAEADSDAVLVALARLDSVQYIHETPDLRFTNKDSRWICQSNDWENYSIHARGLRGANQTVTLMDSGLDTQHCCFNIPGKVVDNRAWGSGTLGANCANEHGTHTAGTAVCGGGTVYDGLAPDAMLIFQDVGSPADCTKVFPPSPLSSAWSDAYTRGSRIHSNSWGGGSNLYNSGSQAIDQFMWNNQDFLILYSAGNNGPGPNTLGSYSNAKNSVTVGGTKNGFGGRDTMYSFSSQGPAGDGRTLPDLLAPAESLLSAFNQSTPSCSWWSAAGTSMAAPAVAGSAALAREYFQRGYYPSGSATTADGFNPSAALLKAILLVSARHLAPTTTRPDSQQGFGRLTLDDALWFSNESAAGRLLILDDRSMTTGFTAAGQEHTFDVNVSTAGPLKVMLVWTDYPGAVPAAKELVNDLDLQVVLANGTTYSGNQGFLNNWTLTPSTTGDRLNNREAVLLQSVSPQRVTVKVRAHVIGNVTAHAQDYALVVVGGVDLPCNQPLPTGVGNTVTHQKSGTNLVATWADRAAHHYVVHRGTTPTFMSGSPAPYNNNVVDENGGTPGIQWTDAGALSGTTNYFYLYSSANACGDVVP